MVTPKTYPVHMAVHEEPLNGLEFRWEPGPQIAVITPDRVVVLSPESLGVVEFTKLWRDAVPSEAAQQAIFDAVQPMTAEERAQ